MIFEGKLHEKILINGVDLCRARESAGISQAGLAQRLRAMGIERIGRCSVSQQRVAELECKKSFAIEVRVFSALGAILGPGSKITG